MSGNARSFRVAVLPGDGIGPEVTAQAVRVLRAVAAARGFELTLAEAPIGGAALDAAGDPLPAATLAACRTADAVLLGAVGGPRWDTAPAALRPERGLLRLRQELGVFANLRPVKAYPALAARSPLRPAVAAGTDLVVVRELLGGLYYGPKLESAQQAEDVCRYDAEEVRRVTRVAARLAAQRRGRLTSVDKANVLATSRLWRQVVTEVVANEFPQLTLEHLLVDACAMHLLQRPRDFDVLLMENLFGDILSDEASVLAGSLGMLPSASLGSAGEGEAANGVRGLYEPVHGSAPDLAGRGVANPLGAILSAALLLRHSCALLAEARAVEEAVERTLARGVATADCLPPEGPETGEGGRRRGELRDPSARLEAALRASLGEEAPRPWPAGATRPRPASTAEVGDAVLAELALLLGTFGKDLALPAVVITCNNLPCNQPGEPVT